MRYSKSKQMIFYGAKYEHMMGGSGLIGFLQILKGLEAEGRRTTSSSARLGGRLRYEDMPKDVATQMAVFWPWLQ